MEAQSAGAVASSSSRLLDGTTGLRRDTLRLYNTLSWQLVRITSLARHCSSPQVRTFDEEGAIGGFPLAKEPAFHTPDDGVLPGNLSWISLLDASRDHGRILPFNPHCSRRLGAKRRGDRKLAGGGRLQVLVRQRVAKVHDGSMVHDGGFRQEVRRPFNTSKTFGFTTLMGLPAA